MFNFFKRVFSHSSDFKNLKNIKIAYVLSDFPTLSQTFVINELRWLKNNGYNVKVFSFYSPEMPVDLDFDLEVIRFDSDDLLGNLEKLLIEHKIELIHTHFVYPVGTLFTFPVSQKLKIPFTLFAHAADIFKYEIDKINKISEVTNSEYCKGIFTLSRFHKNYLIERGVPSNKIIITKQATNYEIEPITLNDNKTKSIVSISRFVEKKGLDDLIDIAKILENENYNFSIYGFGDLEDELRAKIEKLNLNNISIKGRLNGAKEVKKVLKEADLLVSPCKRGSDGDLDGFPTVVFEAMGYGTPILTTNVSAIPEVISDGVNGFIVESNNKEAFALKIKEIMSLSKEDILKIVTRAQKDVQNESSVEMTMEKLIEIWGGI